MFEELKPVELLEYIKINVIIMVANDNELEVAKRFLLPFSEEDSKYEIALDSFTLYCGLFGAYSSCVVKSNKQGSIQKGASRDTVASIIKFFGYDIVIISAGIAFGLKNEKQKIGDILVSESIREYEISRVGLHQNDQRSIPIITEESLFNRFSQDSNIIFENISYSIFKGEMLTSEKLIDNNKFREGLIKSFPNAIGGEMESSGVYRMANKENIPSICIKSISDWGDGTKDYSFQKKSASICFSYIRNILMKKNIFSVFNIPPFIYKEESQTISIAAKDILPLLVPLLEINKLKESEIVTDDYKYYFNDQSGYLFLRNHNKTLTRTLYHLSRKPEIKTRTLCIFITKENKPYIKNQLINKKRKIIDAEKDYDLNVEKIHYVDEFIFELSQDRDIMNEMISDRGNEHLYIDQKIYNISEEEIRNDIDQSSHIPQRGIKHFVEKFQKNSSLISVITGEGGIGKSWFLDELYGQIIKNANKRIIYLRSRDIIDSNNGMSINSIDDLYKIIMSNYGWNYEDAKLLELNFTCGNIVLFIDGLEEVQAALGEDFHLEGFFDSLKSVSEKWQNSKILITTREEYLERILELSCVGDIQFYRLKGFEHDDLEEYLNEVYSDKNKKDKFYRFLSEMQIYDENKRISPLYTDWIVRILDNVTQLEQNKFLISNSTHEVFIKDKLFQLLIQRELGKKSIPIEPKNVEALFSVLVDMILKHHGKYIDFDEFEALCLVNELDNTANIAQDVAQMTLFSRTIENKIKIKYEILNILVPARYLLRNMIDGKLHNLDYMDDILSIYRNGNDAEGHMTEMTNSLISYMHNPERIHALLKDVIGALQYKIKVNLSADLDIEKTRKAISGSTYLALAVNGSTDKEDRSKVLQTIYAHSFEYMSIYGSFYPVSFKGKKIYNGYFYKYDNFNNCVFPKNSVAFINCNFIYTDIKNNSSIRKGLFRECNFKFSNIAEIALDSEKLKKIKKANAIEFISKLADYIRLGRRSHKLIKNHVKPKPKNLSKTLKNLVTKYKFLKREKDKGEYIYSLYRGSDADRIIMKDFGGYQDIIEKLSEEM